jgi:hypothetical protein
MRFSTILPQSKVVLHEDVGETEFCSKLFVKTRSFQNSKTWFCTASFFERRSLCNAFFYFANIESPAVLHEGIGEAEIYSKLFVNTKQDYFCGWFLGLLPLFACKANFFERIIGIFNIRKTDSAQQTSLSVIVSHCLWSWPIFASQLVLHFNQEHSQKRWSTGSDYGHG